MTQSTVDDTHKFQYEEKIMSLQMALKVRDERVEEMKAEKRKMQ